MAWTLCSKEQVKAIYKIDTTTLQDFWSDVAEGLIRKYVHAPYLGLNQVVKEFHSGDDTSVVVLNNLPIVSVSSLKISGDSVNPSEYIVFNTFIALTNNTFPSGNFNVEVDYVSGDTNIPAEVSLACAAMIAAIANYEGRQGTDSSLKWGDLPTSLGSETANRNVGLTTHLKTIMKNTLTRYKVRIK